MNECKYYKAPGKIRRRGMGHILERRRVLNGIQGRSKRAEGKRIKKFGFTKKLRRRKKLAQSGKWGRKLKKGDLRKKLKDRGKHHLKGKHL